MSKIFSTPIHCIINHFDRMTLCGKDYDRISEDRLLVAAYDLETWRYARDRHIDDDYCVECEALFYEEYLKRILEDVSDQKETCALIERMRKAGEFELDIKTSLDDE